MQRGLLLAAGPSVDLHQTALLAAAAGLSAAAAHETV